MALSAFPHSTLELRAESEKFVNLRIDKIVAC